MKFLSLLLIALAACAQPKGIATPELVLLTFLDVKQEATESWLANQKAFADAARKGGIAFRLLSEPVAGDTRYYSAVPLSSMADLDRGTPIQNVMEKGAYDKLVAEARRTTNRRAYNLVLKLVPGATIEEVPRGSLPLTVMTRTRVAADRAAEYENRIKNVLLPNLRKAGVKRASFWRIVLGGGSAEFASISGFTSLADAEKARLVTAQTPPAPGLVLSTERAAYRLRPELSYTQ
jgi:hypothetical protein